MNERNDNMELSLTELWRNSSKLVAKGWSLVPIELGTKACRVPGWTRFCSEPPTAEELKSWGDDPRGYGVGFAMGRRLSDGSVLVGLDGDADRLNEEFAAAFDRVEAALGTTGSPAKVGRRGRTIFMRVTDFDGSTTKVGHRAHSAESWHFDVLATGAQSVCPPSIHPTTGVPYRWIEGRSLWPMTDGRRTIRPAEDLPCVKLADLIAALDDEGFDTTNLRRHDTAAPAAPTEAVPVVAYEELDEAAVVELLDRLEFHGFDLGDLWRNGSEAAVFSRRGKTATGNERRHELGFQMRKAGYAFGDYVSALREWQFTIGNKPFDVDDDLSRPNSRLLASWQSAGRRLAATAGAATEGFTAAIDDGADGVEVGSGPVLPFLDGEAVEAVDMRETALGVIHGVLGSGAAAMVYGPAHAGKSTITHSLCEHIALGLPVLGRKVERFGVMWVAYEDASGAIVRQRLGQSLSGFRHPMIVVDGMTHDLPCLLGEDREIKAFARAIVATLAEAERRSGVPFKVVVIDTLSEGMMGLGDESNGRDMRRALRLVKLLEKAGLCPIVLHHTGKDTSRGARGWSGLNGYFTTIVEVKEGEIVIEKARGGNARKGTAIPFSLVDTALPWSDRSPAAVLPGDFVGAPRVEFGTVKAPRAARRGPARADRPAPGSIGGEVFAALETKGALSTSGLVEAVAAERLARDPDTPASELDHEKLRRAIRTATARWSERGVLSFIGGRWATPDAVTGAHLRAIGDEEAA